LNLLISVLYCSATTLSYGESYYLTWFCRTQKSRYRQKRSSDRKSRRPLVLENVQTNCTCLRGNVGMPYFGIELHFRWFVRILHRDLDVNLKQAFFVTGVFWTVYMRFPVSQVLVD
jgi:hypothetical protein